MPTFKTGETVRVKKRAKPEPDLQRDVIYREAEASCRVCDFTAEGNEAIAVITAHARKTKHPVTASYSAAYNYFPL